jgi:hypothetical protein
MSQIAIIKRDLHENMMAKALPVITADAIESRIHFIRGRRVMLDSDLAAIYGVTTSALNQALKRNRSRFPVDFAFPLRRQEFMHLMSQIVISNEGRGGRRKLPWVFTEHGAIMLATVLNSARAAEMSVFVVRAFVQMREMLTSNRQLAAKLDELEQRVGAHDEVIADLVTAIRKLLEPEDGFPRREIGFYVKEQALPYRIRRQNLNHA